MAGVGEYGAVHAANESGERADATLDTHEWEPIVEIGHDGVCATGIFVEAANQADRVLAEEEAAGLRAVAAFGELASYPFVTPRVRGREPCRQRAVARADATVAAQVGDHRPGISIAAEASSNQLVRCRQAPAVLEADRVSVALRGSERIAASDRAPLRALVDGPLTRGAHGGVGGGVKSTEH